MTTESAAVDDDGEYVEMNQVEECMYHMYMEVESRGEDSIKIGKNQAYAISEQSFKE